MSRYLVTGGAGFVGSHIVDRLLKDGHEVVVIDNLATGYPEFLADAKEAGRRFTFIQSDLLNDGKALDKAMRGVAFVFHMAANADIKENLKEPTKCLEQNTIVTSNVLEAMRRAGVTRIAFASTGSVYGEPVVHPTPEDAAFPVQTSMYGASKLACEGLLEAYSVGYGFEVHIFRFVSLMGERYTHGCVFDFMRKLRKDPTRLEILGDGKQRKSYLYVKDCVDAMFLEIAKPKEMRKEKLNIYNLGNEDFIEVTPIAKLVCQELGLKDVKLEYGGGARGWVGDSPFIHLDISKAKSLGWKPTKDIPECVRLTTRWLKENEWVFGQK
jgi:UDP-glucose 4-epimerase